MTQWVVLITLIIWHDSLISGNNCICENIRIKMTLAKKPLLWETISSHIIQSYRQIEPQSLTIIWQYF